MSGIMDPSKVSGGTFANTLGWLEQSRGKDISTTYAASMNAYTQTQAQLSNDIQSMEAMRYNMNNDIQKFKSELITKMPGAYEGLSKKDRESIENGTPSKSVYEKMDEWSKDIYTRNQAWEEEQKQMQREEHNLKMETGSAPKQKLDFITNIQGAQEWLAKQREENGFSESDITSQEMIDQGLAGEQGTSSSKSLYNSVDDYWTAFFTTMKNSPTADPADVQGYLSKFVSPSDRVLVDISGKVEQGMDGFQKIVSQLEKQFGGQQGIEDANAGLSDKSISKELYSAYIDAKLKLMINQ